MRIIRERCLGLDLHKKQITAHLRVHQGSHREPDREDRRFGTMPADLLELREWVIEHQVTDVVMESTGVYWMHLYELLESVTTPAVVNAGHVKRVPGRKTDVSDAQWLSELHAHGLIRLSFVPPKSIRELRAVTRYRTKLVAIRTAAQNRTIKLIETAGLKLSSVVCDSFGKTGRAILDELVKGPISEDRIGELACGALRKKVPQLQAAVSAPLTEQQRVLLDMHLRGYDAIEAQVAEAEGKLQALAHPFSKLVELLDEIPGVNELAAITVLAETGVDMSVYRNEHHLTSLAGLAPGNSVSADKRRRIPMPKGNRYLKRICVQIAWAASRKADSFHSSRFRRLTYRIGRNKAIVATARHLLIVIYRVLLSGDHYKDLGANFYDSRNKQRAVRTCVNRLAKLGFTVKLEPAS
jgi:transposase